MFNIYCKAIKDHDEYGVNKGSIYNGTFDETKDSFCITTCYDSIICGVEDFKKLFRIVCGARVKGAKGNG